MSVNSAGNFPNFLIQQPINTTVGAPQQFQAENSQIYSDQGSIFNATMPDIMTQVIDTQVEPVQINTTEFLENNASITDLLPPGVNTEGVSVQEFSAAEISGDLGTNGNIYGLSYNENTENVTLFVKMTAAGPIVVANQTNDGTSSITETFNPDGTTSVSTLDNTTGEETIEKFDDNHELTQQTEIKSQGKSVTTNYGEGGEITSTVEQNGSTSITRNADGQITNRTTDKGAFTVTENFSYNKDGSGTKTVSNGVDTTTVSFDSNGMVHTNIKNGETVNGLMKRLGVTKDSAIGQAIMQQTTTFTSADGKTVEGFNVGQDIKIPADLIDNNFKTNNLDVDAKAEINKFTEVQHQKEEQTRQEALDAAQIDNTPSEQPAKSRPQINLTRVNQQVKDIRESIDGAGTDLNLLKQTLNNIDPNELGNVLSIYENKTGHSLLSDIKGEWGLSDSTQNELVDIIADKAKQGAKAAGLSDYDIQEFINLDSLVHWDDDSEKGLNTKLKMLDGAISTAYSTAELSETEAASIIASENSIEVQTANDQFAAAREMDDNIGIAADAVLGWFGCTTIDDMTEKLGIEKDLAEILLTSAKDGDMESFKITYKQIFGQEFNPKTVAAYEEATTKYQMKRGYDDLNSNLTRVMQDINKFQHPERTSPGMRSFAECNPNFEKETMSGIQYLLKMDDAQFAEALDKYGGGLDGLKAMISDIKDNVTTMSTELGSYQSLNSDIKGLRANMFGGKDIIKDVEGFNKRQMATQIGANIIVDVAIAAATGPILGGAAKVVSLSSKGAKLTAQAARYINTAEKIAEGNKILKYGIKGTKVIAKSTAEGVTETALKNLAHGTNNSSGGEIAQATESNILEKLIKKTPLNKAARMAGASVDVVDLIKEHGGDIMSITMSSGTPRADLMSQLKIDADTANYIITNIRAELRA